MICWLAATWRKGISGAAGRLQNEQRWEGLDDIRRRSLFLCKLFPRSFFVGPNFHFHLAGSNYRAREGRGGEGQRARVKNKCNNIVGWSEYRPCQRGDMRYLCIYSKVSFPLVVQLALHILLHSTYKHRALGFPKRLLLHLPPRKGCLPIAVSQ